MVIELNGKNECGISDEQMNAFVASIYNAMLEYFQSEKGQAEYAEFLAVRDEKQAA